MTANYCWSACFYNLYWQNYLTHWLRSVLCANCATWWATRPPTGHGLL